MRARARDRCVWYGVCELLNECYHEFETWRYVGAADAMCSLNMALTKTVSEKDGAAASELGALPSRIG